MDKCKVIVFDADGVLSQPMYDLNGRKISGTASLDDDPTLSWIKYCIRSEDAYEDCTAPLVLQNFVNQYKKKKDLYVLTCETSSFAMYDKIQFLRRYYADAFDGKIHFVSNADYKVPVIKEMAKKLGVSLSEVALIEDRQWTCVQADDAGINAVHISHFLTDGVILTNEYKQSDSDKEQ